MLNFRNIRNFAFSIKWVNIFNNSPYVSNHFNDNGDFRNGIFFSKSFILQNKPKEDPCKAVQNKDAQAKTEKHAEKPKVPKLKKFVIYRYNPDTPKKKPSMQTYTIDLNDCRPMVLDALLKIKKEQDSTLAFRFSCREGICGSCGVNIDGVNSLLCLHNINPKGVTKIYPLPHMYVQKDLIVDFKKFYEQHNRIKPYLIRNDLQPKDEGLEQIMQSTKDRAILTGQVECILCACCSTSCPEYWWHGHTKSPNDFLGPAALLNAHRWIVDSRDQATHERLMDLKNFYAVYRCHQINNCTTACPKKLMPGKLIADLRLMVSKLKRKKKSDMQGRKPSEPLKGYKAK